MGTYYSFFIIASEADRENIISLCCNDGCSGYEEKSHENEITLIFYFENNVDALKSLHISTEEGYNPSPIEAIENKDWNAQWRETIEAVKITDSIWVSPEWLTPPYEKNEHWIKIEPRMAFGTGHHETTRLAAQMICNTAEGKTSLLDIGTGSGILAFVAELAGYIKIVGTEIDPECEINLIENKQANEDKVPISFLIGDIEIVPESDKFDSIIMNIIRLHSEPLLPECKKRLHKTGQLIWSGLLKEEREKACRAAEKEGFILTEELSENEWWAGIFIL